MELKILAFGRIAEITGRAFSIFAGDTDALRSGISLRFPELSQSKFAIAVNKRIVNEVTAISQNDEIALMPAYSGG